MPESKPIDVDKSIALLDIDSREIGFPPWPNVQNPILHFVARLVKCSLLKKVVNKVPFLEQRDGAPGTVVPVAAKQVSFHFAKVEFANRIGKMQDQSRADLLLTESLSRSSSR